MADGQSVPVCAALMRVRGHQLAELPLVATPVWCRRKGHCRVLLNILEQMLTDMSVSVLSLPAAKETVGQRG